MGLDSAAAPVVSVRDLRVTFVSRDRTVHAVNGVSFDLARGEVLGILGESGSGKSVTLRALMGLLPPERTRIEGGVQVAGQDVAGLTPEQLEGLRLLVTKFPTTWFNQTKHRVTRHPVRGTAHPDASSARRNSCRRNGWPSCDSEFQSAASISAMLSRKRGLAWITRD